MAMSGWIRIVSALFCVLFAPAVLAEEPPCGKGLICASKPETLVKGLQEAGYKAKLVTPNDEDPYIETKMSGYSVNLILSDCEKRRQCRTFSYRLNFVAEPVYTVDFANRWNNKYRFLQVYRLDDGRLGVNYDVTTVGGLNQANFTDLTESFDGTLGTLDQFIEEAKQSAEKAASEAKPATAGTPSTAAPATSQ